MRILGYCRVSTEEQAREGLSLPTQEQRIRAYVAAYPELELIQVKRDTGSGKSLNREGLQEALTELREARADGLIVVSLDRLTRSVRDMGQMLDQHFRTCALMCVQEHIDTRTAAGRLMINVLVSVSQWEREAIGERSKAVLRSQKVVQDGSLNSLMAYRKKVGKVANGRAPYGFRWFEGQLVHDATEHRWVLWMQEQQRRGTSIRGMVIDLNARRVPARSGGFWHEGQVRRILNAEWNDGNQARM